MNNDSKKAIVENYRNLLKTHGSGAATSQSSSEGQKRRFEQLVKIANLEGASILDIGCNSGALLSYLKEMGCLVDYTGIDLVPELISVAKVQYPEAKFFCRDILQERHDAKYDYVLMSMLFNNSFDGVHDFIFDMLKQAYLLCNKGMAFNFLSTNANFFDSELAYHDPLAVFDFCQKELSSKIDMRHHYFRTDVSIFVYKN